MVDWGAFLANEYTQSLLLLLAAVIVAKTFQEIFISYVRRLTAKTESDLDDKLIAIASRPLFFLILSAGAYWALMVLSAAAPYRRWIDGIFFVLFVLIAAWMGSRVFALLITRWFARHRGISGSPRLLNVIVAVTIYLAAFIIVLSYFDIEITPFIAAMGIGGLAVGLALQDTLANVFSGVHIIGDQPFKVGDFIELPESNLSGFIDDIGWRTTRIRTLPNNYVVVPNSKIAGGIIVNNSLPDPQMSVRVELGVDYGSDLEKVEKVTIDVARKIQKTVEGAVEEHEPFIRYHTFADSNVNFSVILRAKEPVAQYLIKHAFIKALHKRYAKEGIEISWPIRKNYVMALPKK